MNDDFRFALRQLGKSPVSTILAIVTLAVAIGLSTTIFGLIDALFLRALPFADAARVVELQGEAKERGLQQLPFSVPKFLEFRRGQNVFTGIAADGGAGFTLTGFGEPVQIFGGKVTANYFDLLGIQPIRGRSFLPQEEMKDDVALVTAGFWRRYLKSDPNVIGRTITLEDIPTTIVGVLPDLPVSWFGRQKEIYTVKPFVRRGIPQERIMDGLSFMRCIARLKSGVNLQQAQAALVPLDFAYNEHFPANSDNWTTTVVRASDQIAANLRPAFGVLFGAVSAVLLIACSNVSNLLLIRFMARSREIAIRLALGADRRSVIRLFAVESLLVSLVAGAVGLCIALWLARIIPAFAGDTLPLNGNAALNWPTMAFGLVVSLVAGLAIGIFPAWQSSRADIINGLKSGGQQGSGRAQQQFRRALMIAQVALAVILISAASMLVSSFVRLIRQDPGFRSEHLWVGGVTLPASRYAQPEARARFVIQLLRELLESPMIESLSVGDSVPLSGAGPSVAYALPIDQARPVNQRPLAPTRAILPGFFRTLAIPILSGRDFAATDNIGQPEVVIISSATAKKLFPNQDPIGRELLLGSDDSRTRIVGVVADVRSEHLSAISEIQFYSAWAQRPSASFVVVVRSATTPETTASVLRDALNRIDRGLPILWPSTVDAIVNQSIGQERLTVTLLSIFAAVALLLAVMGVYGTVAYAVEQRGAEIGLRMALGAQAADVVRLVIRQGMTPVLIGLLIGLTLTLTSGHLLAAQLYQVSPHNPLLLGASAIALALAGFLACLIPARRATRVNPVVALRAE